MNQIPTLTNMCVKQVDELWTPALEFNSTPSLINIYILNKAYRQLQLIILDINSQLGKEMKQITV